MIDITSFFICLARQLTRRMEMASFTQNRLPANGLPAKPVAMPQRFQTLGRAGFDLHTPALYAETVLSCLKPFLSLFSTRSPGEAISGP